MKKIIYSTDDIISELRLSAYLFWIGYVDVEQVIPRVICEDAKLILFYDRHTWIKYYVCEYLQNGFIVGKKWEKPNNFLSSFAKRYLNI